MLPIRTVLHPTDFSERAGYALTVASALARDYGARLVVLHVVQPVVTFGEALPPDSDDLRAEARELLDRLAVPGANILIDRRLADGDPAAVILHFARETPADLIVMGTHGRTGLGRLLMGSVAEQVARHASCPVLTLTAPFPLEPREDPVEEALAATGAL
jgi:nucleotide-binding universal stress UspA family protein